MRIYSLQASLLWWRKSLNRTFLSGWSKLVGSNAATAVMQLAAFAIAARALDLTVLGVIIIIHAYVRVIDRLFNFQSVSVLTRYLSELDEAGFSQKFAGFVKAGFLVDGISAVGATLIAISALPFVAPLIGIPQDWLFEALLFCLLISTRIFGVTEAVLRSFESFWSIGMRETLQSCIRLLAVCVAFLLNADGKVFLWIWFCSELIANLSFIFWTKICLKRHNISGVMRSNARETLRGAPDFWPLLWRSNVASAIRMLSQDADVLVAGALLGAAASSLLRVAKNVANVLSQMGYPLTQVSSARISRLMFRREYREAIAFSAKIAGLSALVGMLISVVMVFAAEPVLNLAFGAEFRAAAFVTVILFFARSIYLGGVTQVPTMLALDIGGYILRPVVLGTLAFGVVLALTIGPLGLLGVGIAHIVFEAVWVLSGWWIIMRRMRRIDVSNSLEPN